MKRCAIYIRVSTAEQATDGWSLAAQKAALLLFAEKQGWKVIGVFADEGKTARKRLKDRKEIYRLIEEIKAGNIDVVLFMTLDRWFRNISDFYKIQDILDKYNVEWVCADKPGLDMKSKEGRLQVNILLSVAQNETDATSDRIKGVNKYLRVQKRWTSGSANLPRGFALDNDQHVIIDKNQEDFVRCLISEFMKCFSIRAALVTTNTRFNNMKPMFYNAAVKLLHNTMLYGEYKGIEEFNEPFITKEEYLIIQRNSIHLCRGSSTYEYIFSGMIKCGACGSTMAGCCNGTGCHSYRCSRFRQEKICYSHHYISEPRLERELFPFIIQSIDNSIIEINEIKQKKSVKKTADNSAEIDRRLKRLDDLYISSTHMTMDEYKKKRESIEAMREKPDDSPAPDVSKLEDVKSLLEGNIKVLYNTLSPLELRRFWRSICKSITIKDGNISAVEFIV